MSKSTLKFLGRNSGFFGNNNAAYYEDGKTFWLIDCGITVFYQLVAKFDLSYYDTINILITHLHDDHAGSLSQLLMYLGYECGRKANIFTPCKNIKTRLEIAGVDPKFYVLTHSNNIEWVETKHVTFLDSYGFCIKWNGRKLVYTGDTATLEPFYGILKDADEFYVDVSTKGIVHLKIEDILDELIRIKGAGTDVYLMHLNDEKAISDIVQGALEFAPIE